MISSLGFFEKEEQGWGITIARLEADNKGDYYEVTVHIHYVDCEICLKMAELVQRQLFNLFYPHRALSVEDEVANLVALLRRGAKHIRCD